MGSAVDSHNIDLFPCGLIIYQHLQRTYCPPRTVQGDFTGSLGSPHDDTMRAGTVSLLSMQASWASEMLRMAAPSLFQLGS